MAWSREGSTKARRKVSTLEVVGGIEGMYLKEGRRKADAGGVFGAD